MLTNVGLILFGFFLLLKGGDYLVEGAVNVARLAKLSPMVIGLTVVGFGTSAPELLVSVQAALAHSSGFAIGNVVGSNIANIGMILGVTALICPLPSKPSTLRIEMPFMVLSVLLMVAAGMTGTIDRWQGILGVLLLVTFVTWQVYNSRQNPSAEDDASIAEFPQHGLVVSSLMIVGSAMALAYGADRLIAGASGIAMQVGTQLGVAQAEMERIIGLTIVAIGTSLPEMFASVMAARKGQTDMATGNIIGSVTFNILSVIGFSAAICPIEHSSDGFVVDYAVMTVFALVLYIFMYTHRQLVRWEGTVLLLMFLAYLARTVMVVQ